MRKFSVPLSFKNKINILYKYVHPDVLGSSCPVEYIKSNEKSVQELNSYLESLDKGTQFEGKIISFYVMLEYKNKNSEVKVNYSTMEVKLEGIHHNSSKSNRVTLQLNLNNYIDELIGKIKKMKSSALKGIAFSDKPSDFDNFEKSPIFEGETGIKRIKIRKDDEHIKELTRIAEKIDIMNASKKIFMKQKERALMEKIDQAFFNNNTNFFLNRRNPDPVVKEIVNNMSTFKDLRYFNDTFFPSHLIYFDEKLSPDEIEEFMSKIKMEDLKGWDKHKQQMEFRNIAQELCTSKNLTRIYVSFQYSYDYMPGYLTIPFNFNYKDLISYYQENKVELYRIRERYISESKAIDQVKSELTRDYKFSLIKIEFTSNLNLGTVQDVHIALKIIKKILNESFNNINFSGFELNLHPGRTHNVGDGNENYFHLNIDIPIKKDNDILNMIKGKFERLQNEEFPQNKFHKFKADS